MMLTLQGAQMLQMLENALRKSLPESLKVYGTVFHMNRGNPFKLKALVDKWPDFNTVIIHPEEQVSYQMWNECAFVFLRAECLPMSSRLGSQSSLNEVIQSLAATKAFNVKQTQCFLFVMPETAKRLVPSLVDAKNVSSTSGRPKAINQEEFKLSSLDITHAALVNKFWHFGGNERSQRFIERCIRTFPTFCLLGPERSPVSWTLMDQTGELRMAGTVPQYRAQGLISSVIYSQIQALDKLGFPLYAHTDKSHKIMQKMSYNLQHIQMPCDWNQWNCVPL
ncbi:glycine N-acyltransferase-like [Echinops telfairi]|uniref:Glycine N-acyltransferase-like n=1 Tax=Echinops telfairi TaxID=9371 RepID=A0AC55DML1_ECHTE|nr:glycine N-acyltransferase-like [Echinops telfairi]